MTSKNECDSKHCIACYEYERSHIETVLIERFNYFIVFYGVIVVGAATVKDHPTRTLVLGSSSVICFMIFLTLWRAQARLDAVVKQMSEYFSFHPIATTGITADNRIKSKRYLVGIGIPLTCLLFLTGGTIVSAVLWQGEISNPSKPAISTHCEPSTINDAVKR